MRILIFLTLLIVSSCKPCLNQQGYEDCQKTCENTILTNKDGDMVKAERLKMCYKNCKKKNSSCCNK